ncbi:MAG: amidohydrolase [Synergistaceae bacterium]|nr:amidohydrolase [Synergistaceae bacterium]
MRIDFLAEAESLRDKLTEIRQNFHRIPERGNHEFKTASLIEKYLDEIGISHKRILGTGIVAKLQGNLPGRSSAIRADIDALPITEKTGCDFQSQNSGFMHACGHDVHITSALGAAMILTKHEDDLFGSVKFLFQPDEEGNGGAKRMIDEGCIDDVDAVFGCHVDPKLPAGHIGIKYGNFYAASAMFKIIIIGKSSHGAQRENGIDSIEIASLIVTEILKIQGGVVSVGTFNAGTAGNILAGTAELKGIIRTFGVDERLRMCNELEEIVKNISSKFGAKYQCHLNLSTPGIINDDDKLTSVVEYTAREIFAPEKVHIIDKPLMISEDFGYFIMAKTGNFYHIGAGSEYPLHSDKFLPDPDSIVTASAFHSAVVYKFNTGLI